MEFYTVFKLLKTIVHYPAPRSITASTRPVCLLHFCVSHFTLLNCRKCVCLFRLKITSHIRVKYLVDQALRGMKMDHLKRDSNKLTLIHDFNLYFIRAVFEKASVHVMYDVYVTGKVENPGIVLKWPSTVHNVRRFWAV